jgi:hypothetical protein
LTLESGGVKVCAPGTGAVTPLSRLLAHPSGHSYAMRNLWIGMIIGAATGAAIGGIVDGTTRARLVAVEAGHTVSHAVKEHVPEARERLQKIDLPSKAHEILDRAAESQAGDATRHLADAAKHAAGTASSHMHRRNAGDEQ